MELAHKRIVFTGLLVVIGLAVLALPFYPWGFMRDDPGFLAYAAARANNCLEFFKPHNVVAFAYPSAGESETLSWSGSFYRPMQSVHFALEHYFFGSTAYAYLIFATLLHAGIIGALFFVGSAFFPLQQSFFVGLALLLHPMIMLWIGRFTHQLYVIDVIYFLMITWALKKFCDTRRWFWFAGSSLLFFTALLAKETLIVYPAWAGVAVLWYQSKPWRSWPTLQQILQAFYISIGYGLVGVGYLVSRYLIFGGATNGPARVLGFLNWQEFMQRQSERLFDLVTYVCNYLYIGVIPGGCWVRKAIILVLACLLLVYPFIRRRQLLLLAFLSFSLLMVTWPAWLLYYHTRYAYAGFIFLYFVFLFALNFYLDRFGWLRRFAPLLAVGVIGALSYNALKMQQVKNMVLSQVTGAAHELALQVHAIDKPLIFVGLPHCWFASGAGQSVQLFYPHARHHISVCEMLYFRGDDEFNPLHQHDVVVRWLDESSLEMRIADGENIILPACAHEQDRKRYQLDGKDASGSTPLIIRVTLDQQLLARGALVFAWDYRKHKFVRV